MKATSESISRLDAYLGEYQWRTAHAADADAEQHHSYDALVNTPVDSVLARLLVSMRGMKSEGTLKQFFLGNGFALLEESWPEHLIIGLISQPWRIGGGLMECAGGTQWNIVHRADHAKIAVVFGAEKTTPGKSRIYTETRILVEDASARKKFAAYWFLVKPWSNMVRHSWLNDAKMIAERKQLMNSGL